MWRKERYLSMATKSFEEKVVVEDQKMVAKMKKKLESSETISRANERNISCTSKQTTDNSKKWNI